jgi:hypothetical protein
MKKNPINESGKKGEDAFENFSINYNIPYIRSKSGKNQIDFILFPNGKKEERVYIDIKNQHTSGGRDLAVAGCVWKYQKKYGFTECYIVEGTYDFDEDVRELANTFAKTHFVKFEEMKNIILNKKVEKNIFF